MAAGDLSQLRIAARVVQAFAALCLGIPAVAAPPASPPSACREGETVLFECPSRGKRIAVCASAAWSGESGYVEYRFGRPKKPELTIPARGVAPRDAVSVGVLGFSGGGADYAVFESGGNVYTVYSAVSSRWGLKSGVTVDRDGERMSVRRCDRGREGEFAGGFTTRADLRRVEDRFVLPP